MDNPNSSESGEPLRPPRDGMPLFCKVLLIVLGVGLLVLLVRALVRGGAGAVVAAAAAPAVAVTAYRPRPELPKAIDRAHLLKCLRALAERERLVTPRFLFIFLRRLRVPLTSEQQMARELKALGLRSEVRTVPGREERRWYDVSRLAEKENGQKG